MNISDFSIKNYPFTIVIFLLLSLIGLSALKDIPRTEDPYFDISAFRVKFIYPGASPVEVEQQVVKPIEDSLRELEDLIDLDSSARDSGGTVILRFKAEIDVDRKFDEINRELGALRPTLPAGLASLEIVRFNPGFTNIIQYSLVSDTASDEQLETLAEDLTDALESLEPVRESDYWALPDREVRVTLNFGKLAELGINPLDVASLIQGESLNIPGGAIEQGDRRFTVQTSGQFKDLEDIRNTVIAGTGSSGAMAGRLIRLSDVAEVDWNTSPIAVLGRHNGKRAVFVTANQKEERNIFVTQKLIDEAVARFEASLPANVELIKGFEQYKNVDERLSRLEFDFTLAVLLVLITLLPLGLRAAGIVMIAVPLSLLTGLACLYFAGFSLNQLSIAGLVVALGLLVDDSIVVIENIARYLRMGYNRVDAAIYATRQISLAVVGCTATLLFAFLPLLMLPENAGKFIRSLPVSVVFTVTASLFVALTIIPFLASRLLKKEENEHGNLALQKLTGAIDTIYTPLLRHALKKPKTVTAISLLMFAASLGLAPIMGMSLFPKADTPQFLIEVSLPPGSSLSKTDSIVRLVEAELQKHPEITDILSTVGEGNPQIYYNIFQEDRQSHVANVFVQLQEFDKQTPALLDSIRQNLNRIAGANIVVREFENGPPIDAPIGIRISGPNIEELQIYSRQIEAIMQQHPGTQNVNNPQRTGRSDLRLELDSDKAGLLGVRSFELDRAVRLALNGFEAGELRLANGDAYPIVVRGPSTGQPNLATLNDFHVINVSGQAVPLSQITQLRLDGSVNRIDRHQRQRSVLLNAFTVTGYNTEQVVNELIQSIDQLNLPDNYTIDIAGAVKSRKESFAGFGTAILITVFGILAVLVLEFGSFKSSLIVLFVIPLGVMGGMTALFLAGYSLSFTAIIGFIALTGIEIKNSILLVDFTNQLRQAGKGLDEAIEEAGRVRFLPILLTSATAVGGLMPLALQGGGLYSPMAWVIIGGLISSTFVGRLVTPVLYKLLPPKLEGIGDNQAGPDQAVESKSPLSDFPGTPRNLAQATEAHH